MKGGIINTVKYGFPGNVECHASVLATANPLNNKWRYEDKVGAEEFPLLLKVIDRFDLIFVVREIREEKFLKDYVNTRRKVAQNYAKGEYDKDKAFLQKYITLAKGFKPKISQEADILLDHFFRDGQE
jgi:DNA replicative helicase MCM subunit Mcm2 (Cdc46/Mcm family)